MTGSWLAVLVAFALVGLNAFFVATEFALVKVRPTRLDELGRRGVAGARRMKSQEYRHHSRARHGFGPAPSG